MPLRRKWSSAKRRRSRVALRSRRTFGRPRFGALTRRRTFVRGRRRVKRSARTAGRGATSLTVSTAGKHRSSRKSLTSLIHKTFSRIMWRPQKMIWNDHYDLNILSATNGTGNQSWLLLQVNQPFMLDQVQEAQQSVSTIAALKSEFKGLVRNRSMRAMIRNNGRKAAEVSCYVLYPKHDIPLMTRGAGGVAAPFIGNKTPQALQDSLNDACGGGLNGGVTGNRVPTINDYSVTPYMIPLLTRGFKIKKLKTVQMAAGGQWNVNLKAKDFVLDRSSYNFQFAAAAGASAVAFGDVYACMRAGGPVLLVTVKGTPGWNNTIAPPTGKDIDAQSHSSDYWVNILVERRAEQEVLFGAGQSRVMIMNTPFADQNAIASANMFQNNLANQDSTV